MVQFIQRSPSFGEQLGQGLGQGFSKALDFAQQMQLAGMKKKQEDLGLKQRGIQSIEDMREILSRGNTGWNFFNYATPEGRGDRAAMDAAALNLERLAVEMQGKGTLSKPRFEYMVKRLPSSSKSDAENAKILDEWEKILTGHEEGSSKKSKKSVFDPSNKEHKAKATQLYKTYGDKEKVREKLKLEFEGL